MVSNQNVPSVEVVEIEEVVLEAERYILYLLAKLMMLF